MESLFFLLLSAGSCCLFFFLLSFFLYGHDGDGRPDVLGGSKLHMDGPVVHNVRPSSSDLRLFYFFKKWCRDLQ